MEDLEKLAQEIGATIGNTLDGKVVINLPPRSWTPEEWNAFMARLGDAPVIINLGTGTFFTGGIFETGKATFAGQMHGAPMSSVARIKLKE